jgi:sensor histidine kinase regulating citrate/malate metabolism
MKSIKDYGILTENQLLKQHIIMQEKHSIEIKNLYKEIETIRHDIKNQLISIRTFVEDNNNDRALNYISDIIKEIDLTKKLIFTKNDMFNAIIDNKFSKANSKGIKTSFMIYHELEKQINDADINILFGNLLDNAIEACGNLVGEKEIQLLIEKKRDYILIQVKNTIENSVLQDNPKLLTSKVDKFNHGMGIRSIRKIVRKYDGIIDFSESRNMFICDILILDDNS